MVFLMIIVPVVFIRLMITVVAAASSGKKGRQLGFIFLKACVVAFVSAYLLQLAFIFPRVIESSELKSTDGLHSVTLELQAGGYSLISFIPVLGAIDIDSRSVHVRTNQYRF